jgi:hypothetical protein
MQARSKDVEGCGLEVLGGGDERAFNPVPSQAGEEAKALFLSKWGKVLEIKERLVSR